MTDPATTAEQVIAYMSVRLDDPGARAVVLYADEARLLVERWAELVASSERKT